MYNPLSLTEGENGRLTRLVDKVASLTRFLNEEDLPDLDDVQSWFFFTATIRTILGNFANESSFLGGLLAKAYLQGKHSISQFDVSGKLEGAPGLDIDLRTDTGERIVGELKTTFPYGVGALGAQQKVTFLKDFQKLTAASAQFKYFFVTEQETFEIVRRRYSQQLPGVTLVLLPRGVEEQF